MSLAEKNKNSTNSNPIIQHVSDTAYWVASHRALESKRKNPLFLDPLAEVLIGEHGRRVADAMKSIKQYSYWSVIIRTCLIDEYILKYLSQGYNTVINLGAGLDTRPYRLALPEGTQWIEIDFPDVMELKNQKLHDQKPNCQLERIGLDLSDQVEREQLFNELNQRIKGPAIILTEGVVPYLTEDAVSSLASAIKEQPNFTLWISEYYAPEVYPRLQNPKFKDLLGNSPFQFFPSNWNAFFENCGWKQKEIQYLYDVAEKHNRKFPLPWWVSILKLIMGEEKVMRGVKKISAYVVFEKIKSIN